MPPRSLGPLVSSADERRIVKTLARIVDLSLEYFCPLASHTLKLCYQMHKHGVPGKPALCNYDSSAHCLAGNSSEVSF